MHTAPLLQALSILLLASMLAAGSAAAAPSSGIRLELTHVDAKGGFTKYELMRRAMNRTRLRAAMLQAVHGTDPTTPFTTYSHILSTTHVKHEEYLMQLAIGGSPSFNAGADTGSNLIWIEDKLCPPAPSSTLSIVPCCSTMCKGIRKHVQVCSDNGHGQCTYHISYGGGESYTEGSMRNEDLTLLSDTTGKPLVHIPGVAIGCSTAIPKELTSNGIVGLGRGPQSLVAQLGFGKFSYCLNNYSKVEQPSALLFGAVPDHATGCASGGGSTPDVATTPLLQVRKDPSKYYVHLEGISIGKVRLSIPKKALEPHGNGAGNMFIDTGCSYSILEKEVFEVIVKHMDTMLKRQTGRKDKEVCYQVSREKRPLEMPDMVLHFLGGANMNLKWEQYTMMMTADKPDESCLAFDPSIESNEVSVLGNFQQHNTHMLVDTIQGSVSFVPADCSKF